MGRKFLSILGTSNYNLCTYTYDDKFYNTRFIQEALLKICFNEFKKDDQIIIFMTKSSYKKNWKDNYENTEGLEKVLSNNFRNINNNRIKKVYIDEYKMGEEEYSVFSQIYKEIDEGDEIIFDITHGIRTISMTIGTLLSYTRIHKKIKIAGVYYGAYECRDLNNGLIPIQRLYMSEKLMNGEWME